MRHVIVGGGIAGTTAAEELRKLRPDDGITIVSEEQHPIYSRVLLPHFLNGKVPRERVFLKKEQWYAEHGIEWLRGTRVDALDLNSRFAALSDGRELPFDRLLIAAGGEVRTLPDDLRGISYFRTLDDADHLLQLLGELPSGARGAIYGGGFIACEYLNLFAHAGLPTTVALRGPHFWSHVFDAETGALVNGHLRSRGVEVAAGAAFAGVKGEREVRALRTDKGTFPCSILGIGVGIEPDLSWIRAAGIEVGSGILTNEYLETNRPDVYAAGDAAEFFDTITGRHLHVGNWMNAMSQGRTAAKNMAGERTAFQLVSSYATNALGLEIIFVGDVSRAHADGIAVYGSASAGGVTQLFSRDGRLVGATIVGRNADRAPATKAIQARSPLTFPLK